MARCFTWNGAQHSELVDKSRLLPHCSHMPCGGNEASTHRRQVDMRPVPGMVRAVAQVCCQDVVSREAAQG